MTHTKKLITSGMFKGWYIEKTEAKVASDYLVYKKADVEGKEKIVYSFAFKHTNVLTVKEEDLIAAYTVALADDAVYYMKSTTEKAAETDYATVEKFIREFPESEQKILDNIPNEYLLNDTCRKGLLNEIRVQTAKTLEEEIDGENFGFFLEATQLYREKLEERTNQAKENAKDISAAKTEIDKILKDF